MGTEPLQKPDLEPDPEAPEPGIASAAEAIAEEADHSASKPDSPAGKLPSAITSLLSARIAIISAESNYATSVLTTKFLWAVVAGGCALIALLLILVAGIGLIAAMTGLSWFYVAFIVAAVFLLVAIIGVSLIRKKTMPLFPITRSEFEKDRTWLTSIKTKSTSKS